MRTVLAYAATRGAVAATPAVTPDILIVTFGKGVGVSGAAVLCSESLADYLTQFARHLIYSTSMPPAQAAAISASLAVIRSEEGAQRRHKLNALIAQFRAGAQAQKLRVTASDSAIQPLIVGENSRALHGRAVTGERFLGNRDSPANRPAVYRPVALNAHCRP